MKNFLVIILIGCLGAFIYLNYSKTDKSSNNTSFEENNKTDSVKKNDYILKHGKINTENSTNQTVSFEYFIPSSIKKNEAVPVLIFIPGLNGRGSCKLWTDFASDNGFIVISPGFRFNRADWDEQKSYQYPDVWSGQAVIDMVSYVRAEHDISTGKLYLAGHSAGAQFAQRFPLWSSDVCAAAVHAAGGVTSPDGYIDTKFFITVGDNDIEDRKSNANYLKLKMDEFGIFSELRVYSGVGHGLSLNQINDTKDFFLKVYNSEI